jgi:hypothetical protein
MAIHGHKHRAFIWRSSVFHLPENAQLSYELGQLSILGGGSAGSSDTTAKSNYFSAMTFAADGLTVTMFRAQGGGAFAPVQKWHGRLALDPGGGGLRLQDWVLKKD